MVHIKKKILKERKIWFWFSYFSALTIKLGN